MVGGCILACSWRETRTAWKQLRTAVWTVTRQDLGRWAPWVVVSLTVLAMGFLMVLRPCPLGWDDLVAAQVPARFRILRIFS